MNGISASRAPFRIGLEREVQSLVLHGVNSATAVQHRSVQTAMQHSFAVSLAVIALTVFTHAQDDLPVFKTEATSAFVWGQDSPPGGVSSSIVDPVTGNAIHKLNHAGIEVSSKAGFETVGSGGAGELLSFTATIANNTESDLSVRHGGASVDGRIALPLAVVHTKKGFSKKQRSQVVEVASMNCFSSGFLPNETFLSPDASSTAFTVTPKKALTVSFVVKDPRYYSVLCSAEGCFPKGTIRFSVTVNTTDFVFIWPGRSMVYCGK